VVGGSSAPGRDTRSVVFAFAKSQSGGHQPAAIREAVYHRVVDAGRSPSRLTLMNVQASFNVAQRASADRVTRNTHPPEAV
jgi:hypothetical protein